MSDFLLEPAHFESSGIVYSPELQSGILFARHFSDQWLISDGALIAIMRPQTRELALDRADRR